MSHFTKAKPGQLVTFRTDKYPVTAKAVCFSADSLLAVNKKRVWDKDQNRYRLIGNSIWVVPYKDIIEVGIRPPREESTWVDS